MEIDFTYLETVSDGDKDFIYQFIKTFDETVESLTAKMRSELEADDYVNLGKSAHQLKPSAKMLGLLSGDQLEELQNNPETATGDLLDNIKSNCREGLKELTDWAAGQGVSYP